jgi:translation initiation factor IF-2
VGETRTLADRDPPAAAVHEARGRVLRGLPEPAVHGAPEPAVHGAPEPAVHGAPEPAVHEARGRTATAADHGARGAQAVVPAPPSAGRRATAPCPALDPPRVGAKDGKMPTERRSPGGRDVPAGNGTRPALAGTAGAVLVTGTATSGASARGRPATDPRPSHRRPAAPPVPPPPGARAPEAIPAVRPPERLGSSAASDRQPTVPGARTTAAAAPIAAAPVSPIVPAARTVGPSKQPPAAPSASNPGSRTTSPARSWTVTSGPGSRV